MGTSGRHPDERKPEERPKLILPGSVESAPIARRWWTRPKDWFWGLSLLKKLFVAFLVTSATVLATLTITSVYNLGVQYITDAYQRAETLSVIGEEIQNRIAHGRDMLGQDRVTMAKRYADSWDPAQTQHEQFEGKSLQHLVVLWVKFGGERPSKATLDAIAAAQPQKDDLAAAFDELSALTLPSQ